MLIQAAACSFCQPIMIPIIRSAHRNCEIFIFNLTPFRSVWSVARLFVLKPPSGCRNEAQIAQVGIDAYQYPDSPELPEAMSPALQNYQGPNLQSDLQLSSYCGSAH